MARTPRITMERTSEQPTLEAIAAEAYAIYLADGARDGYDIDHWLEAERRIIAKAHTPRQPDADLQQDDRDRVPEDRNAAIL